ncbi:hypothetical protein [Methanosarcina sp.]|uniref:hypothetical protein n=1 Tax=Methanosarcina sp. TaxID=2213 RepID=UPI002ABBD0D3|nr:hypothetical protein [Methanosarcina sp.]MDY9925092.1 hypothetical protein [Methanosarcina sp.]
MSTRRKILSQEEKVALEILDYNKKSKPIYFSKLTEVLEGDISRSTINKIIDKLFDLGMIDGKWETHNGKWVRTLYIKGEYKKFFEALYENVSENLKS